MSMEEYIRKERELIKRACKLLNITPLEWIEKYAVLYHEKHALAVIR